ncbi:MAG: RNA-binding protein [Acidobacteriota bacterium]
MSYKLYVGGLSPSTTADDLRERFAPHGTVVSASVVVERDSARSRGFGFVQMASEDEAKVAIQALDKTSVDGLTLIVNPARSRTEKAGAPSPEAPQA